MMDWCYFSSGITIFCHGPLKILISHDFFVALILTSLTRKHNRDTIFLSCRLTLRIPFLLFFSFHFFFTTIYQRTARFFRGFQGFFALSLVAPFCLPLETDSAISSSPSFAFLGFRMDRSESSDNFFMYAFLVAAAVSFWFSMNTLKLGMYTSSMSSTLSMRVAMMRSRSGKIPFYVHSIF